MERPISDRYIKYYENSYFKDVIHGVSVYLRQSIKCITIKTMMAEHIFLRQDIHYVDFNFGHIEELMLPQERLHDVPPINFVFVVNRIESLQTFITKGRF